MRGLRIPSICLLFLLVAGCGHYYMPGHVLDTPEAIGRDGRGRFEAIGVQGGRLLTGEPQQDGPDPDTGVTPKPYLPYGPAQLMTGFQAAVGDRWDVGFRFQAYAPPVLRAKFQLAGEPESRAAPGNFSAAALVSGGPLFGAGGTTYFLGDLALLLGARPWQNHLFSIGGLGRIGQLNTQLLDTQGTIEGTATSYGLLVGYQYTVESLIARTELSWTNGTFRSNEIGGVSVGGLVGFRF